MWSRKDRATTVVTAAVLFLTVGLWLFPPAASPAASRLHCQIGPFTTCLVKAINLSLANVGLTTRADSATCDRRQTRCEVVLDRGSFCSTARITIVEHGRKWNAGLGQPHDCASPSA
jgi:hypothetical protein